MGRGEEKDFELFLYLWFRYRLFLFIICRGNEECINKLDIEVKAV